MPTLHPLSHSSTQTQTITNTNSLPPISPPTFSAVHSDRTGGCIWGLFRWQLWPLWTKPCWAGFHFSCQFGHLSCAADVVQLQQSQTRTLRSRSTAGVAEAPVSRLGSLSLALLDRFSFKYLCHYSGFSCVCFGLEEPLSLSWWKPHISITSRSKLSNAEPQTTGSLAFM